MTVTIAIAGKGGVGKTTVSGLMVETLRRQGKGPVLVIDADPNATLAAALGVDVEITLGELQAETLAKIRELPSGVPLGRHIEYELHKAVVEGDGFDLLTMGRGEGPGCYCAVNSILRRCLEDLSSGYPYVVLDNEAGLEHLSRRISQGVDGLLVVSDGSPVALRAAARINGLVDALALHPKRRGLLLNNLRGELGRKSTEILRESGMAVLGSLDYHEGIAQLTFEERPLSELPENDPVMGDMNAVIEALSQHVWEVS